MVYRSVIITEAKAVDGLLYRDTNANDVSYIIHSGFYVPSFHRNKNCLGIILAGEMMTDFHGFAIGLMEKS